MSREIRLDEEEVGEVECSRGGHWEVSQCWGSDGEIEDGEWLLINQLDGRAVVGGCGSTKTVMKVRDESDSLQRWRIRRNKEGQNFQLVNVGSGKLMSTGGISDYTWGLEANAQGFSTLRAAGGVLSSDGKFMGADRGWTQEDGVGVGAWTEHGAVNQRFKLEALTSAGTSTSSCN